MSSISQRLPPTVDLPLSNRLKQVSQNSAWQMKELQQSAQGPQDFVDLLSSGVSNVNGMQSQANQQINQLLTGGDVSEVEVFTAVQKADMAFRLLVQIRNKLLAAYEELNAIRV